MMIENNDDLCRLMNRIVAQIRSQQVRATDTTVSRTEVGEGVIYGITVHLEPNRSHPNPWPTPSEISRLVDPSDGDKGSHSHSDPLN